MPSLATEDLVWCLNRMSEHVRLMLKRNPNQLFVAGGFIRSCVGRETINDIDIFAATPEVSRQAADWLRARTGHSMHESPNAYTIRTRPYTTQFIHRWTFDSPVQCIASFDFTIAKAAIWWDGTEWKSDCHDRFYQDLAAKRLVYTCPVREEEAGGSMLRVLKFYQRGYRIPMSSLAAVINRIAARAMQIIPMDEENPDMGPIIETLLKEVDPEVDPTHEAHDVSIDPQESARLAGIPSFARISPFPSTFVMPSTASITIGNPNANS